MSTRYVWSKSSVSFTETGGPDNLIVNYTGPFRYAEPGQTYACFGSSIHKNSNGTYDLSGTISTVEKTNSGTTDGSKKAETYPYVAPYQANNRIYFRESNSGSNSYWHVYGYWNKSGQSNDDIKVILDYQQADGESFAFYKVELIPKKGNSIGSVASSSSDEYPSDGEKDNFWYIYTGSDSIDPLSVEYSTDIFEAGQSIDIVVVPAVNTLGGIVSYQYQYSIDGGYTWNNAGNATTTTTKSMTIPNNALNFSARVLASDNLGFTSDTYVTGPTLGAQVETGGNLLFAGGYGESGPSNTVDCYNKSLTHSTVTPLSQARAYLAATSIGEYALFGGGSYYNSSSGTVYSNTVDAYNKTLTRSAPSEQLISGVENLSATSVGNYTVFAGGRNFNSFSSYVNAYNKSLTRITATNLSEARYNLASTTVSDKALFAGGTKSNGASAVVDAYNQSLSRSIPDALGVARSELAATTANGYAIFAGGGNSAYVEAYDSNLTRTILLELSVGRSGLAATTLGSYAMFGGGNTTGYVTTSIMDIYDKTLTRRTIEDLSLARGQLSAGTIGVYSVFAGGQSNGTMSDIVDVYRHI